MADSSGIQMLEDFTATRYLITTTRVRGQLKIEGVDYYLDSSEQVFQFIPGVEVNMAPDAELMEAIIIRERHVPPDYERFVPESSAITINDTGIKCLAPGAYVFEHSQRRSPWDKRPSEWNIDSISGLQEPFPSIAVSRRSAKLNCEHSINFVKIRKEERTHLHPSFIEFYYCAAGAIEGYSGVFTGGRCSAC